MPSLAANRERGRIRHNALCNLAGPSYRRARSGAKLTRSVELICFALIVVNAAVAYLLRDDVEWGFPSLDGTALAAAAVLVLIYPYVPTKVGLAAVLIIAGLTASRTCCVAARTASH